MKNYMKKMSITLIFVIVSIMTILSRKNLC